MELKIGITDTAREVSMNVDLSKESLYSLFEEAMKGENKILTLDDDKGKVCMIPAQKIAYIELRQEEIRKVGFA